jgi:xyloglucan:xyloglucosyl transferase
MVRSTPFSQPYSILWGPQHQSLSSDQTALTLWLDRSSGSGFKSKRAYRNGYFGVSMKVQPGYTAGVNTAFYVCTCLYRFRLSVQVSNPSIRFSSSF